MQGSGVMARRDAKIDMKSNSIIYKLLIVDEIQKT